MASIKPIEGNSVHRIQSGQVIVDLCSVVKELVENSLDAGAMAIDVRFKNYGVDSIEVQDNGQGVSHDDYETVALKHYTSKLSNYDDLTSLQTFGFRGEALSSLCAVSNMHIITAREDEAPKGTRLDFELSGKLKGTQVVASQRGTTVAVETIFKNLPVRRQELEKNIKREYGKVLALLQAYACVTTTARISVSNATGKGQRAVVFSTKSNQTTKDNIANIFGAKTLPALIPLDLEFDMEVSSGPGETEDDGGGKQVRILGHVSRPIFGEGRPTPDRQMFYVNGRPCSLPQIAKVFNEVYKSYNLSQSPFIFANVVLDTNAYDVNVSPDKRTILLHDQGVLLESIRTSLTHLFENQQHTVPHTHRPNAKLPDYKPLTVSRQNTGTKSLASSKESTPTRTEDSEAEDEEPTHGLIQQFAGRNAQDRAVDNAIRTNQSNSSGLTVDKQKLVSKFAQGSATNNTLNEYEGPSDLLTSDALTKGVDIHVRDFNRKIAEQQTQVRSAITSLSPASSERQEEIPSLDHTPSKPKPGVVPNAFDRMRPLRTLVQTATITVGSKTIISEIGSPSVSRVAYTKTPIRQIIRKPPKSTRASSQFASSIKSFAAPSTQINDRVSKRSDTEEEDIESQPQSESFEDGSSLQSNASGQLHSVENGRHGTESASELDSNLNEEEEEYDETESSYGHYDAISDEEFIDDETKKAREEAKVVKLIQEAEARAAKPSQDNLRRAQVLLSGGGQKEMTRQLIQVISTSIEQIDQHYRSLKASLTKSVNNIPNDDQTTFDDNKSAEERLSLAVSKEDFARMRIIGQFNLGFIIAIRPSHSSMSTDELFIIDQHASDEKYNFERLQATTIVQNQRLVHPQTLDLTAIEEEIILENQDSLVRNGFLISVDESGAASVGQRCKLLSLPMSKEVTFSTRDLEELLVLLSESPPFTTPSTSDPTNNLSTHLPRPSKVRRMFAMRACRSSVMIGKTLTNTQMARLVERMGELEKPWNCPHGRPTMRHLAGLGGWRGWLEGKERRVDGESDIGEEEVDEEDEDIKNFWEREPTGNILWKEWLGGSDMGGCEEVDDDEGGESGSSANDDHGGSNDG